MAKKALLRQHRRFCRSNILIILPTLCDISLVSRFYIIAASVFVLDFGIAASAVKPVSSVRIPV